MLAPAPAATPLTRAITGCGSEVERAHQRVPALRDGFAEVDRLAGRDRAVVEVLPAQKPRPAPVSTMTRASPRLAERVAQLLVHPDGEAVEPVRPVERDPRDGPVRLEVDGLVSHARGLAKERPWTQTKLAGGDRRLALDGAHELTRLCGAAFWGQGESDGEPKPAGKERRAPALPDTPDAVDVAMDMVGDEPSPGRCSKSIAG